MLHHAYYWRERNPGDGPGPAARYVKGWGRPGDTVLIAVDDGFPSAPRGTGSSGATSPDTGSSTRRRRSSRSPSCPSRRGRGIGEALLEALCERARADGYRALSLSVERDNAVLVSFYEQHGFAIVDGGDDYSVTMRRPL